MSASTDIFDRALIGMVHVGALPGTPFAERSVDELAERAAAEAKILAEAGFDAIIIENMHDRPYRWGGHGPEITAAMTAVGLAVRAAVDLPMGVQVLSGGHREAVGVALASGGSFIRVENFVHSAVADEGLIERAVAGELLRYRRAIGAEHIAVCADIQKKHASHAVTADLSVAAHARAAEFFGADALIVSGAETAGATDAEDVRDAKSAAGLAVLVGSGVTPENAGELFDAGADALIVGSWIKAGGEWTNAVDPGRAAELVRAARGR